MDETKVWRWFDHNGGIVGTPATDARPTAYGPYDRYTHWMFGQPSEVPMFQAITLCGRRALEIPGRGEVDCPECIKAQDDELAAMTSEDEVCRVYWGAAGCELPRGHGPSPLPMHRDGGNEVTAETAVLFGEDLTDAERKTIEEMW